MHQMLGDGGSTAAIADEATVPRQREKSTKGPKVPAKSTPWPENVRLAVLVARAQGMSHPAIAEGLSDILGKPVDAGAIRFFCSRRGVVLQKRAPPIDLPERYRQHYAKVRAIVGVEKARKEIERLVARDRAA